MNHLRTSIIKKGIGFTLVSLAFGLLSVPVAFAGGGAGGGTGTVTNVTLDADLNNITSDVTYVVAPAPPVVGGSITQTWTQSINLYYAPNRLISWNPSSDVNVSGYYLGIQDPSVTIVHTIVIKDHTTHTLIPAGGAVTQGQTVDLIFQPFASHEISWFATGYSLDSPYGSWVSGATAPPRVGNAVTCNADDYVEDVTPQAIGVTFQVYSPFQVDPPVRTITIPAGLTSCSALTVAGDTSATMTCTVSGLGTITPTFNYANSFGMFYYRYYDPRDRTSEVPSLGPPGCYGNNIAMSNIKGGSGTAQLGYAFVVPAVSGSYSIASFAASNNPPSVPTLTCPAAPILVNAATTFTVNSTDPDGDQLRYGFDWTGSGVASSWFPAPGYTAGGVNYNASHSWAAAGSYVVKVLAQDSKGANSAWNAAPCTVTVLPAVTGSCSVAPTTGTTAQAFTWTAAGASGGTGSGYTYAWTGTNLTGHSGISYVVPGGSYAVGGPYTGSVTITDGGGHSSSAIACSNQITSVTAAPLPVTGSCSVNPTSGPQSTAFLWSTSGVSGGTSPYTYAWTGTNLTGHTGASYTVPSNTYAVGGPYSGSVTITDSLGSSSGSISCTQITSVTANPGSPTITSCIPAPSSVAVNVNTTWTPAYSNFTQAPNTFAWTVVGGNPSAGALGTFTSNFAAIGNYSPHLVASNSGTGESAALDCSPVAVTSACGGSPTPTVSAASPRVIAGSTDHLTWSGSNVNTSCVVTNTTTGVVIGTTSAGACSVPLTGSSQDPIINTQTTFCNVCDGNQLTKQCVTVNVVPSIIEF
jgi:hypothetical protein